jgi:hypothetical protein
MTLTNNSKIMAVGLAAALLGGSVGAFVGRSTSSAPAPAQTAQTAAPATQSNLSTSPYDAAYNQTIPVDNRDNRYDSTMVADRTYGDRNYKDGFVEGFRACEDRAPAYRESSSTYYRPARTRYATRRVYYDYSPRKRTFWQKHRDKLTVAMGAGTGAAVGALVGGKKGAAWGALGGGLGSALWTYKLRKRD